MFDQSPVTDEECELILSLLPRALNEAGIALALGDLRPSTLVRINAIIAVLLATGRIQRDSPEIFRITAA
jgi:hypothetical protein